MLKRYKLLINQKDNEILIPISNIISPNMNTNLDDTINSTVQTFINPIVSGEKEAYYPIQNYKIFFRFYNGTTFNADWNWAGFSMDVDLNKNIFKKSMFLVEFYDGNSGNANTFQFSTTLSVIPNSRTGKGSDGVHESTYTISNSKNELYYIYYDRNIIDVNYKSLYLKPMFLNAKTGDIQYFINSSYTETNTLTYNQFNDTLYFYEIRFFPNYTYGFYRNDILQTEIYFNELIIK